MDISPIRNWLIVTLISIIAAVAIIIGAAIANGSWWLAWTSLFGMLAAAGATGLAIVFCGRAILLWTFSVSVPAQAAQDPVEAGGCHAIVKCPETWIPSYVNGGHECLVVRVCERMLDAVPPDQFSASADRHVAQRNIAVVPSASPAAIDLPLDLGYWIEPAMAEVDVAVEGPESMDWLKLYANNNNPQLHVPVSPIATGMLPPHPSISRKQSIADRPFDARKTLLRPREKVDRGCDKLAIPFHASIQDMKHGEAQVLRVRQRINGEIIGG